MRDLPRLEDYPRHFESFKPGLGLYKGQPVSIEMDPQVKPIFLKARTLAYSKREGVEKELLAMVKDTTLTRVQTSACATPIIPIDKGNGRFRICGDYKVTVN